MDGIRVGNAPCSWGNLEFKEAGIPQIAYSQVLDEIVETGYEATELGDWGFMPSSPGVLRGELDRRGLTMLGAFVPVALTDPARSKAGKQHAVRVAELLAGVARHEWLPLLVLADENGVDPGRTRHAGRITPEFSLSPREWAGFCDRAMGVAREVLSETGLHTAFHHHCAGYVETPDEIAAFLDGTDPELIGLVFDTGHFLYGTGQTDRNALTEGINRFSDRIAYLHLKDCSPIVATMAREREWDYFEALRAGVFCEVGTGMADFPGVVTWLRERPYRGFVCVEQDVLPGMGSPKASALRNRAYLASLGL